MADVEAMLFVRKQLFEGNLICFAPINHEHDPEILSRWSHDVEYLRLLDTSPAYPRSTSKVKKQLEKIEKRIDEEKNLFFFMLRARSEDRLIGFAMLDWISWSNRTAWIKLGIGDIRDRQLGYGSEALAMLTRYAFNEINLHRISAAIPEYHHSALRFFQKSGFSQEVCRRQAIARDGRRWDLYLYGLLREEWLAHSTTVGEQTDPGIVDRPA